MPALVLGYETSLDPSSPVWTRWTGSNDIPAWLMFVEQQAGGYAMSYWNVLGAVLRLEANTHRSRRAPGALIAAFHAMAEDSKPALIRRNRPELVDLCRTSGGLYTAKQLGVLSETLRSFYELPICEWGLEAFVRLQPASPAPVLGWRRVEAMPATIGIGEDWPDEEAQWSDGKVLSKEDVRTLTEIGSTLLAKWEPPSLYLIWENSD